MATLQPTNLTFYHPCDSLTDADGNLWSTPDPGSLWPGALLFPAGGQVGQNVLTSASGFGAMSSGGFGDAAGAARFTTAVWVKDPTSGSGTNGAGIIGFSGGGPGAAGSLQGLMFSNPGTLALFDGNGNGINWATGTMPVIATGWHFYVMDLERSGGDWVLRHSTDGAAFTTEAAASGPAFTNSPSDALILIKGPNTKIDETAVWLNLTAPFTTTELQNLYDLGNVFGVGLNQYDETFLAAPLCWQVTAIMPGGRAWRDSGSGPCPPVLRVPRGAEDVIVTDNGLRVNPVIRQQ